MIDFSTLKGLAIPEGVVTQIVKDGVVLWSAVLPMAKVIVGRDAVDSGYSCTNVIYETPKGVTGYLNTSGEYELPIGTVITCEAEIRDDSYRPSVGIYVNDETVDSSDEYAWYVFTLNSNVVIQPIDNAYAGSVIYITEIPENHALVVVEEESYALTKLYVSYVDSGGNTVDLTTKGTYAVPLGTTLKFTLDSYDEKGSTGILHLTRNNGTSEVVASATDGEINSYTYTFTTSIIIECVGSGGYDGEYVITEQ